MRLVSGNLLNVIDRSFKSRRDVIILSVLIVLNLSKILALSPVSDYFHNKLKVVFSTSSGVMCLGFKP